MVSSKHRSLLVTASENTTQRWIFPTGKTSFCEWNITWNQCRFPWILLLVVLYISHRCRIIFECVRCLYCVPKQKLSFSTFRTSMSGANRSGSGARVCSTVMLCLRWNPSSELSFWKVRTPNFSGFFPRWKKYALYTVIYDNINSF